MPEQPDWMEVSTSIYDCEECGERLDMVVVYPDDDDEEQWLACPHCGWEEHDIGMPTVEDDWYNQRYSG